MSLTQLDSETADRNLTSLTTVLTHTPSATLPMLCQGLVFLGDGSKDLDGSGGLFEFVVTVGGQTVQPSPQGIVFGTEIRCADPTVVFPVPANKEVILRVKSPNGADTDIGVTAYLYDTHNAAEIADAVCDEVLTGATHNEPSSLGRRIRQLEDVNILSEGTAQAGGANNEIILEAGENSTDNWYRHTKVVLTSGTGSKQSRHVHSYDGDTLTAIVYPVWVVNPAADTKYTIYSAAQVHAMMVEPNGIENASFAADVGSTAYATNRIALAVRKVLDELGLTGPVTGTGSESWTLTCEDGSGNPISGAEVWVSTDVAGSNVVAGTSTTDDFGRVTFQLDVGTYYRWADHANYNFTNPSAFVVS